MILFLDVIIIKILFYTSRKYFHIILKIDNRKIITVII